MPFCFPRGQSRLQLLPPREEVAKMVQRTGASRFARRQIERRRRVAPVADLYIRVRKRFAADGLAGVVRRDAIGFPGEEIAFPGEEFALPGKGFGFPGGRFAFPAKELRFPGEELGFPGVEFAFPEQVLTIPGARKGRFWAVF